jgi:hypothetical protein
MVAVLIQVEVPPFMERLQNVDYMKVGLIAGAGIVGLTLTVALFRVMPPFPLSLPFPLWFFPPLACGEHS